MMLRVLGVLVLWTATLSAADKPSVEKLVGAWKMTRSDAPDDYVSRTVTFNKDGTFELVLDAGFEVFHKSSGKWSVEGNKLMIQYTSAPKGSKPAEYEIVKFTDDEWTQSVSGKKTDWKRIMPVKDKK